MLAPAGAMDVRIGRTCPPPLPGRNARGNRCPRVSPHRGFTRGYIPLPLPGQVVRAQSAGAIASRRDLARMTQRRRRRPIAQSTQSDSPRHPSRGLQRRLFETRRLAPELGPRRLQRVRRARLKRPPREFGGGAPGVWPSLLASLRRQHWHTLACIDAESRGSIPRGSGRGCRNGVSERRC